MAACGGRYWEPHNGFPKHLAVLRGEATQGRSPVDGYPAVLSTNAFPVRLGDLLTPFYPARTAPEVRVRRFHAAAGPSRFALRPIKGDDERPAPRRRYVRSAILIETQRSFPETH